MNKKIMLPALVLLLSLNSTFAYSSTIDLDKNINQIKSSIQKAHYKGADEVIYRTITAYRDNTDVQILAAVSWALQSKLELAQDQINKLKVVAPKSSDLHFAQGVVFYKRINSSDMDFRGKADSLFDIAKREFLYAIQLDNNNYKAYNALAVLELKSGEFDNAKEHVEKALSLCPEYAIAIDNLGSIYFAQGDLETAELYFKEAVSTNENTHSAYYHLAQIEFNKGNYNKCLTYINKCLAWQGYSSYAYNLKGDALRLQGNEVAAIAAYKKAIEITPENLAPYANLASIYEGRKDFELALDAYKSILSINPNSEQTLLKVADMYLESGKYSEAIAFYNKLNGNLRSEAVKGVASAYYGIAINSLGNASFASDKRLFETYLYLDRAIKANPNDLELYLAKAKLSALINKKEESVENLNIILKRSGNSIEDYLIKGDAYSVLGNHIAAKVEYASAIHAAKTLQQKLFLGELFTFNKQFDDAIVVLTDLLTYDKTNLMAQSSLAYINKSRSYANYQTKNAKYFRLRNSMIFEREFLNKALKADPYNVEANILMGRLNQRQHKYEQAYNCYSIVVARSTDEKTVAKYTKRLNKMKSKIEKKHQKELLKQSCPCKEQVTTQQKDDKIVPKCDKKEVKKEVTNSSAKKVNKCKSTNGSTVDYTPREFDK